MDIWLGIFDFFTLQGPNVHTRMMCVAIHGEREREKAHL